MTKIIWSPVQTGSPPTVTPTGAGTNVYQYVVTTKAPGGTESGPSLPGKGVGNVLVTGQYMTVSWAPVTFAGPGTLTYRVYKASNGVYGYIGTTPNSQFVDDNIAPDLSRTPPIHKNPFSAAGNYPAAVAYFEQRRCFAGLHNAPNTVHMTRSGTESDTSYSLPSRPEDAIEVTVAARQANAIRHLLPVGGGLLLLTSSTEWVLTSTTNDAVTPGNINVRPQSSIGCNNTTPLVINNTVVFVTASGGHLQDLNYSRQAGGYVSGDLSLRANHLFDGYSIVDLAHAKTPHPTIWAVSSSGLLLSVTYLPDQNVNAVSRHVTEGVFESCCVVPEDGFDVLYVVVRRTLQGVEKRLVERLEPRVHGSLADAYFVDCGASYRGVPVRVVSGLDWLEGETVNILADGAVVLPQTVVSGQITLDEEASVVHVGKPLSSRMRTLPFSAQVDGAFGGARPKNVSKVWIRVFKSSGYRVGAGLGDQVEPKQRTYEPIGTAPNLVSDEIGIVVRPQWTNGGQIYVEQTQPLPLTVICMTVDETLAG